MPGLFDPFFRALQGKPMFEDTKRSSQKQTNTSTNGSKEFPRVYIDTIEFYEKGGDMSLNVFIRNASTQQVFIDKIRILGTVREIDRNLPAGDRREYVDVYKGSKPKAIYDKECIVEFHDESRDYFRSDHRVEYEKRPDGLYGVKRIVFTPPIRDI